MKLKKKLRSHNFFYMKDIWFCFLGCLFVLSLVPWSPIWSVTKLSYGGPLCFKDSRRGSFCYQIDFELLFLGHKGF